MLVHLVETTEHRLEVFRPDGQHRREADCGVHGIPPADPVPEPEHIGGVDAELGNPRGIRRNGREMLCHGLDVAAKTHEQPVTCTLSVGHRLQRREGLGRDDEQRFCRVELACRFHEIRAVDVGDKPERQGAVAIVLERLVGHHGPQVRPADPDIDDVANALAGVAFPGATSDPVGEVGHPLEHGVDLGHHVLAIDDD